jgi:hypothetical protein
MDYFFEFCIVFYCFEKLRGIEKHFLCALLLQISPSAA